MRYYTGKALGRALGIGEDAVRDLTGRGVIREGLSDNGLYTIEDSAREVIAHLSKNREGGADYATERARLMRVKRRSAEYDLGLREGELHTTEDVEFTVGKVLSAFRSRVRAIPARVAPQCVGLNQEADVYDLLKQATDEALEELSDIENIFAGEKEKDGTLDG